MLIVHYDNPHIINDHYFCHILADIRISILYTMLETSYNNMIALNVILDIVKLQSVLCNLICKNLLQIVNVLIKRFKYKIDV